MENWKRASSDLGFQFVAPFEIDAGDLRIKYFGHLPQFGPARGMLLIVGSYTSAHLQAALDRGFGYSCLSEETSPYYRESFVEMLSDWGWCGQKEKAPSWLR